MANFISKFKIACCSFDWKQAIIPFYILLGCIATGTRIDFDYYFLVENGKWIVENQALPFYDWMSMHDNLSIIVQQYPISIIIYLIDVLFGEVGNKVFFAIINMVVFWLIFKLTLLKSKDNYPCSYVLNLVAALFINASFGTIRPQIFSCLFVVSAVYILEHYKITKKKQWLFLLPGLALIQCNFHSTFFLAIIGVYGTYLLFELIGEIKNKNKINYTFIILFIISILTGFINPYGIEACLQPFFTSGYKIYSTITELKKMMGISVLLVIISIIIFCFSIAKNKDIKDKELFLLTLVTGLASLFCIRVLIFYIPIFSITLSSYFELKKHDKKEELTSGKRLILTSLCCIVLAFCTQTLFDTRVIAEIAPYKDVKDYCIENNIDCDDKTFYATNIIEGQYMYHFLNMRPYIDGRLETFIDSLNHQYDYSTEYINVKNGLSDMEEFINKYNFDFLLIEKDTLSNTLINKYGDEKYNMIYENEVYKLWQKKN